MNRRTGQAHTQQLGTTPPARAAFKMLIANTTVTNELMATVAGAVKHYTWPLLRPNKQSDGVKQIIAGALRAANVCDGMVSQSIDDYNDYVEDTFTVRLTVPQSRPTIRVHELTPDERSQLDGQRTQLDRERVEAVIKSVYVNKNQHRRPYLFVNCGERLLIRDALCDPMKLTVAKTGVDVLRSGLERCSHADGPCEVQWRASRLEQSSTVRAKLDGELAALDLPRPRPGDDAGPWEHDDALVALTRAAALRAGAALIAAALD